MGESLFEEEFTVEALSQMGNPLERLSSLVDFEMFRQILEDVLLTTALTCLVYNIFRYEQLCRCQPALVEKALANVQG
jgi:hypothetical protein